MMLHPEAALELKEDMSLYESMGYIMYISLFCGCVNNLRDLVLLCESCVIK